MDILTKMREVYVEYCQAVKSKNKERAYELELEYTCLYRRYEGYKQMLEWRKQRDDLSWLY